MVKTTWISPSLILFVFRRLRCLTKHLSASLVVVLIMLILSEGVDISSSYYLESFDPIWLSYWSNHD